MDSGLVFTIFSILYASREGYGERTAPMISLVSALATRTLSTKLKTAFGRGVVFVFCDRLVLLSARHPNKLLHSSKQISMSLDDNST